jgi:isoleucyl-tRNA synthetase
VPRKAGWDTHGLPVEVEVEKELGIHGRGAIVAYGVEPFTHRCIESVFRYTDAWEKLTERIGFWVDLTTAYVTYHKPLRGERVVGAPELFKKGLLYQGHKVVWWWPQGGTALSVRRGRPQGYKTVDDPSVFVRFRLRGPVERHLLPRVDDDAVDPAERTSRSRCARLDYATVEITAREEIVAKDLVAAALVEEARHDLARSWRDPKGAELVGERYTRPSRPTRASSASRASTGEVIAAEFVTLGRGHGHRAHGARLRRGRLPRASSR